MSLLLTYRLLFCAHLRQLNMRPLTEEESKTVFTKLANYIVSPMHLYPKAQMTDTLLLRARI